MKIHATDEEMFSTGEVWERMDPDAGIAPG